MSINTKNNLIAIVLIILFVILFMLYSYFSGMQKKVVTDKNGKYLMLNESLIWQKKGNKFVQIKSVPEHFFDYKFTLYHGTSTLKNTIVDSYDTFYSYYDKDYKELKYDDFRGISRNLDVKFPDYKININSSSDDIYLNEILNKYGYNDNNYYSYYVTLDFDNDGTEEILYATTNYSFGSYNSDYHSFFYMVKNDKLSEIIEKGKQPYNFVSILDIDNDNNYEVVMSYNVKNNPSLNSCYKLYKYKNNKWNLVKDCEA